MTSESVVMLAARVQRDDGPNNIRAARLRSNENLGRQVQFMIPIVRQQNGRIIKESRTASPCLAILWLFGAEPFRGASIQL